MTNTIRLLVVLASYVVVHTNKDYFHPVEFGETNGNMVHWTHSVYETNIVTYSRITTQGFIMCDTRTFNCWKVFGGDRWCSNMIPVCVTNPTAVTEIRITEKEYREAK